TPGNSKDDFDWALEEAKNGYPDVQAYLGELYFSGVGIKRDYAKALYWYKQAASKNNYEAIWAIGLMHEQGAGVTKDYTEAARQYQLAATHGLQIAEIYLGNLYVQGEGVKKNYSEAKELFISASKSGNCLADANLLKMYWLDQIQVTDNQVNSWMNSADRYNFCLNNIAWYMATIDNPKKIDLHQALQLAEKAADSRGSDAATVDTLAAAQAAVGQFQDAVKSEQEAIEMQMKIDPKSSGIQGFNERLKLYQAGKRYFQKPLSGDVQ
ncbi:MAG: hypothetical protein ACRESU_08530, partial [Gammaproteobacteria bacterium]